VTCRISRKAISRENFECTARPKTKREKREEDVCRGLPGNDGEYTRRIEEKGPRKGWAYRTLVMSLEKGGQSLNGGLWTLKSLTKRRLKGIERGRDERKRGSVSNSAATGRGERGVLGDDSHGCQGKNH